MNEHFSQKAQEDIVLINSALNGDGSAYTKLLNKYFDSIYYMLLRKVNSVVEAEDLAMETFGKAFNNLVQYTPEFAFSTWLFRIANNNCIDYLRKKRAKTFPIDTSVESSDSDNMPPILANSPNPEESIIKEQKALFLLELIKKLKPRYAKLIELRYYQELSYEEIGKELDLPIGTVKAQLFRARELLYPLIKFKAENI
ncbi:MAG: sigma-70 family RNA polymerase sigma factor [Bacteroidales bacterium]|nr:sigma-70 family RNA polymerase sigma factor [Bacteroidales bacterium]HOY39281.1 sigma-70 family RNA polymerase sigma factor [Bacteroidales bacterium]HQP03721.1 sigma-70 family RNA polymerase sigma factor [Bacteroidales bacterium]